MTKICQPILGAVFAIFLDEVFQKVDTWLTEFQIDRIHMVLQKGYILYV